MNMTRVEKFTKLAREEKRGKMNKKFVNRKTSYVNLRMTRGFQVSVEELLGADSGQSEIKKKMIEGCCMSEKV